MLALLDFMIGAKMGDTSGKLTVLQAFLAAVVVLLGAFVVFALGTLIDPRQWM